MFGQIDLFEKAIFWDILDKWLCHKTRVRMIPHIGQWKIRPPMRMRIPVDSFHSVKEQLNGGKELQSQKDSILPNCMVVQ